VKQRLGALLCIALGAVLVTTGLNAGGVTVGGGAAFCQPPANAVGIAVPACPTGTISITKTVLPESPEPPSPADGWVVHVTSTNCLDPAEEPVDITLNIATGATEATGQLFLFTSADHTTPCQYALTEDAVANFTSEFSPASPVTIPFNSDARTFDRAVSLTNTFTAPSSSAAPSSSTAQFVTGVILPSLSQSAVVADTGPHEQVRASIWIGIALCLLGLVLLFSGRARSGRARHTD
jgi:hypothetical protein